MFRRKCFLVASNLIRFGELKNAFLFSFSFLFVIFNLIYLHCKIVKIDTPIYETEIVLTIITENLLTLPSYYFPIYFCSFVTRTLFSSFRAFLRSIYQRRNFMFWVAIHIFYDDITNEYCIINVKMFQKLNGIEVWLFVLTLCFGIML